ncbi:hypothetical protein RBB50_000638 [Rhinocladiella similis]
MSESLPDFDSLPKVEGQPQGNAWAYWGKDDQLGTLNLLTKKVKKEAVKEVRLGESCQLDLRLDFFSYRVAGREGFKQKILDFKETNAGGMYEIYAHDDVVTFNTQGSSQWDGFRHVGLQGPGTYFNGMKHEEISRDEAGRNGIHKWVEKGGIVGRGVLLDYLRWQQEMGNPVKKVDASTEITVDELESVASYQGTSFKPGDILIIRMGFIDWYNETSRSSAHDALEVGAFIGLQASMEMVKWIWNNHFAAIACDSLGLEVCPSPFGVKGKVCLHEWMLAHWGCPIGELWNLEGLSKLCAEAGKWSFLFTSAPLHVFGGVGSPANAIALL